MLPTHKTMPPKKLAPKHTMSQGNAPHPPKGKLIYPHTINILHLSFHHSRHFLSSLQHAHTSLKSSKSNTYKTKRPLYSTWLYKGLFLRYLLYFILSLALSFCLLSQLFYILKNLGIIWVSQNHKLIYSYIFLNFKFCIVVRGHIKSL